MAAVNWTGGTGNWTQNPGKWSTGTVPAATDDVTIGVSGSDVTLSAATTVKSVTLGASTTLEVLDPGHTDTVSGNFTDSGTLYIDATGSGGGSTVTVGGTFTNSGGIQIGGYGGSAASLLTVHALSSTGYINLLGDFAQATLNVVTGGAPTSLTGSLYLRGSALLEYAGGGITTITSGSQINIEGSHAFVADVGATGSNSALTNLSANAGALILKNGASIAAGGDFSNSGVALLDVLPGSGGSSFTLVGKLTNSGGLQVGAGSLSATTSVTVGALANSGSIFLLGGGFQATMTVAGAATNSGTIDVATSGLLTVSGASNAFAQSAGSTTVDGALTAPAVNLTGGTVQGKGTITGAVKNTAGTIVGGSASASTPGTLTISGNYNQSGTGTVQSLLAGTGSGQVGIVAVNGAVSLQGGSLQITAVNGQMLNSGLNFGSILTFTQGKFTGVFGALKASGQTGNGTSVNLGNGSTLGATYNVAAGNIQVSIVATPVTTTDTWTGGTGNWTTAASWSGGTPYFVSDVVIGASSTVTLGSDATIDSLTMNAGGALQANGSSLTAGGAVTIAAGSAVTALNVNAGGAFSDSGTMTISGTLDFLGSAALSGSGVLSLNKGTVAGSGTLTAAAGTMLSGVGTVAATFVSSGAVQAFSGQTLAFTATGDSFAGSLNGGGTLVFAGGSDAINSGTTIITGGWTISGAGTAVTVNENLSYAKTFTDGAGTTLAVASGDTLTFTGTATFAGVVSGAGTLVFGGGSDAVNSGATITISAWTISGTGTAVTINEALSYAKAFTDGAGTTLSIASGDVLTLTGSTTTVAGAVTGAGTLAFGGGSNAINSGATIAAGAWSVGGSGTTVGINENLTYAGTFADTAGKIAVASGDTLTLTGSSTLAAAVNGSGTLAVGGGSATLNTGAAITTTALTTGGNATVTLGANFSYAGSWTEGASTVNLGIYTLTLNGLATFNTGAVVNGSGTVTVNKTVTLAGLTLGGAAQLSIATTINQSGQITLGDVAGSTASMSNHTTGTYNFTTDIGVSAGASGVVFYNYGAINKTGGTGTTTIAVKFVENSTGHGAITISTGTIAFTGTGNLFNGTIGGQGTLAFTGGSDTINSGTTITVTNWTVSGAGTAVSINENLSYAGTFTAGGSTTIASGNTLTLTGSATVSGAIGGAATLSFAGGNYAINSGASITTMALAISGASTTVVNENLSFAGTFSLASGGTLGVASGDTLTLSGSTTLSGTLNGPGSLATTGTTTLSSLKIGGSVNLLSYGVTTQATNLTVGDAAGPAGTITNETGGTYNLTNDSGIYRASGAIATFVNQGLLQKATGTGTSAISETVTNSGTIQVTSGTIDIQKAVSGTGSLIIGAGAALKLDAGVAATQTVQFTSATGNLAIGNTAAFAAAIAGFKPGDTIDLVNFGYSQTETVGFTENGANTQGTLTVDNGSQHFSVTLFGQYAAGFHTAMDSGTGTIVTYTSPGGGLTPALQLAAAHH